MDNKGMKFIFKTGGTYLGFISNGSIFSRDGEYLGWFEGIHAWDKEGRYRGRMWGDKHIIINQYAVQPLPKVPRPAPPVPALPDPPPNIAPVSVPTGWRDGF